MARFAAIRRNIGLFKRQVHIERADASCSEDLRQGLRIILQLSREVRLE